MNDPYLWDPEERGEQPGHGAGAWVCGAVFVLIVAVLGAIAWECFLK